MGATVIPAIIPASLWLGTLLQLNHDGRSAAIKEVLLVAGLCLFSFRHELPIPIISLSWVIIAVVSTLVIFSGFTYGSFGSLQLLGDNDTKPLGKTRLHLEPVLFRCKTHHTRLFPQRHSFAYSVLQCGIPLRFQGSIGRLFSFHNGRNDNSMNDRRWSLFSIDSRDYLRRGDETIEEKMKAFLSENVWGLPDMNLDDYPTVYLVTAPRFLGYQFNPVSFWYLKDKTSVLSLVILEVNNTFDERHMYLCRPSNSETNTTIVVKERQTFTRDFPKSFHVSPFNDRAGKYNVLTRDPLSEKEDSNGLINTTITLYDDFGKKKLIAGLRSVAPPIFLSDLSISVVASLLFVVKYGWSGLITFPRIVWEASKLFGVKKLKVYLRPEVKGKTISRNATVLEIELERYFRLYLHTKVEKYPKSIIIHYNPAGIGSLPHRETFHSPLATKLDTATAVEVFDITVFSPRFYTAWASAQSMKVLLPSIISRPEEKRIIHISNPIEIAEFLDRDSWVEKQGCKKFPERKLTWSLIRRLRGLDIPRRRGYSSAQGIPRAESEKSSKDHQILSLPDVDSRAYEKCVLQALLTETIGLGDGMLLRVYDFIIRGVLVYLAWSGFAEAGTLKPWGAIGGLAFWRILKAAA